MKKSTLLIALLLLSVAGCILHYRAHPILVPDKVNPGALMFSMTNVLAFLFSALDVVLVTTLFLSRKTAVYGYLFNGLLVIYGTIFMAHYSILDIITKSIPVSSWLIKTTIPHICISWADFLIGKSIYDFYQQQGHHS